MEIEESLETGWKPFLFFFGAKKLSAMIWNPVNHMTTIGELGFKRLLEFTGVRNEIWSPGVIDMVMQEHKG